MPLIRVAIGMDGPVIDLGISIGSAGAHDLITRGRVVSSLQSNRALIDTGADRTAIHPQALASINSPPSGTIKIRRPGSAIAFGRVGLHDVRVGFAGVPESSARAPWIEVEAAAVAPADPHILALIGRDVLAHCQFVYDGPRYEVVLVY